MAFLICNLQRSTLFCANIVKKDPGRARQNSIATAGTNFTKPGAQNKVDLCQALDYSTFYTSSLSLCPYEKLPLVRYHVSGSSNTDDQCSVDLKILSIRILPECMSKKLQRGLRRKHPIPRASERAGSVRALSSPSSFHR